MSGTMLKLGPNGRLDIPADFRKALGIEEGDELLVRIVDGELRISTLDAAIARAQKLVERYLPSDGSLVEDLIARRRGAGTRD